MLEEAGGLKPWVLTTSMVGLWKILDNWNGAGLAMVMEGAIILGLGNGVGWVF